jgi:hypothetical protein
VLLVVLPIVGIKFGPVALSRLSDDGSPSSLAALD